MVVLKPNHKIISISATLIALVSGLLIWSKFQSFPNLEEGTRTQELGASGHNDNSHAGNLARRAKQSRTPSQRDLRRDDLKMLRERWLKMGAGGNQNEVRLLSSESVRLLGCSDELVELIDLLHGKSISNVIDFQIIRLFKSDRAGEARTDILTLTDQTSKITGDNFRQKWSYLAGASCTAEEINSFRAALGSKPCSQEALFGYNRKLASTDPESAVRSTVLALGENVKSPGSTVSLFEVMNELPENTNFEEIEKLLPGQEPSDLTTPVNRGRMVLLEKWAHVDPAGAANYIMEDFQRFSPKMLSPIASAVTSRNRWSGKEWVQTFPDGPYYDAAAGEAIGILMFGDTNDAIILAERISDPAIKESWLRQIHGAKDNGKHLYDTN